MISNDVISPLNYCGTIVKSTAIKFGRQKIRLRQSTCETISNVGGSGPGKRLVGHVLPENKRRCVFGLVNCGALVASTVTNDAFGYATKQVIDTNPKTVGIIAATDRRTIFFDEVRNLSLSNRQKLPRSSTAHTGRTTIHLRMRQIELRFAASTNLNIKQTMARVGSRHDLFHSFNVYRIRLPPLKSHFCNILF